MANRGPPPKLGETEPFHLTVPKPLYVYLEWLARHSFYGPTIQDVVIKLLTERVNAMFDGGYHHKEIPRD